MKQQEMNDNPIEVTEAATAASSSFPSVVADFKGYTPPFDVVPIIEKMLTSVPPKYLLGLNEIILTNSSGLSRKQRRSVTKARRRKVRMVEAGGAYHQPWQGKPAWIEIFVDNKLRGVEKSWWLKIPYVRETALAGVLFHEIGHHIHTTIRPEYRDKEDVADTWKIKLNRHYFRSQHPWVRAFGFLFRPLLRLMIAFLRRKLERNKKALPG